MRSPSPPYRANRRFAVGWDLAEKKPHKGQSPTAVFQSPEATRSRRRSVYRVLSAGLAPFLFSFQFYLYH